MIMNISEVLSTPYVLEIESVENANGEWVCVAAYSELPNCLVEDKNALRAIDKLEERRLTIIFQLIEQGEAIPVPRPQFKDRYFALTTEPIDSILQRLNLGQWLTELKREVPVHYFVKP
jgi:hypothetical protein